MQVQTYIAVHKATCRLGCMQQALVECKAKLTPWAKVSQPAPKVKELSHNGCTLELFANGVVRYKDWADGYWQVGA